MYEQHFGFRSLPFSANPVDWRFFESESSTALMTKALHTLQSDAGIAVVTGPDGVGKTVLLSQLQLALANDGHTIILPGTCLQSIKDLYHCIRRSMQTLDGQSISHASGRWETVERLQRSVQFSGPVGLLVDDAHLLPTALFTEFQFLIEQHYGDRPLCRLLLAGSLTLEETLAEPSKSGFAQRIRSYTFLQPLRPAESVEYLNCRLSHVGGVLGDCFDADAVEIIVGAADGSPRCLNLLADESLVLACRNRGGRVTADTVRTALNGLQHLPHVWNISVSDQGESGLDDTATPNTKDQSYSDGVIEIGTVPEPERVNPDAADLACCIEVPADIDNCLELNSSSGSSITGTTDEPASVDELPVLDELVTDSWSGESLETESADPIPDDLQTGKSHGTFSTGYRLAELESVGDPSVEIDDDFEQRLIHMIDVSDCESVTVVESSRLISEILPNFPLWNPPGSWDLDTRRMCSLTDPETLADYPDEPIVTAVGRQASVPVPVFEINIPAINEPVPVWPPQTHGIGPVHRIPENTLENSPVSAVPADSGPTPMTTCDNTTHEQRPMDVPAQGDSCLREDATAVVPFRIAGRKNKCTELQHNVSEIGGSKAVGGSAEQGFTLSVTKHNVPDEYGGTAADSGLSENGSDVNFSTEGLEPPTTACRSKTVAESNAIKTRVGKICENTQSLTEAGLTSQSDRKLSNSGTLQQFRVDGLNSGGFPERSTSREVSAGDGHAESVTDQFSAEDLTVKGFHNLFTRMRARTQ